MLASGGDRRIAVPRGGNTNVYGASPYPRSTLGYAASTANDISLDAFHHLEAMVASSPPGWLLEARTYRDALEIFRARIRTAWGLDAGTEVIFAPSGTDLEFVALSLATARAAGPVTNILLGQDEVGSGCIHAAAGRYFAEETAVNGKTGKGQPVAGLGDTTAVSIPVRDAAGQPAGSARIASQIEAVVLEARHRGRQVLVHVVHGSKTGLVLPEMAEIDRLRSRFGESLSLVVDACQARIEARDIRAYLDRQAIVLLTGSKFMGGPPFSGFALVPQAYRSQRPLAAGLATIFRRAEWPLGWPSCDHLPESANPGLLLRLEAALFELERYASIDPASRDRVTGFFTTAVRALATRLGVRLVGPALESIAPHQSTLATLDLSLLPGRPDLAVAQRWCRVLAARGLRLGQPVKCVRNADGEWAGTLRISLSMPLVSQLAGLSEAALAARFSRDMSQVAGVLEAAQRPIVA